MSTSIRCGQCGQDQPIQPGFTGLEITCSQCGHSIPIPGQEPASEVAEVEVAEVEVVDDEVVDVVEVIDVDEPSFGDIPEFDADPLAATNDGGVDAVFEQSPSAPESPRKPVGGLAAAGPARPARPGSASNEANSQKKSNSAISTLPLIPIVISVVASLALLALGIGLWMMSGSSDRTAGGGGTSGSSGDSAAASFDRTETPWDVADVNRGARHSPDYGQKPVPREQVSGQVATRTRSRTESQADAASTSGPEQPKRSVREILEQIKASTVFIKVETTAGEQTGSGFLYGKSEPTSSTPSFVFGSVVTNAHVIEPEEGSLKKINCIFYSGTSHEFSVEGAVSGIDVGTDIACLSLRHDQDLPKPISLAFEAKVHETETVLAAGFPFGDILKTSKRNPAITITKGSVSSIRLDDYDMVSMLQIDGGINPGNSGGPVVNENGRLIGIAVAKLQGTSIGFAIPAKILEKTLRGRVSTITVTRTSDADYKFDIEFVDPSRVIESGELIAFAASDQAQRRPADDGYWTAAAETLLASSKFAASRRRPGGSAGSTTRVSAKMELPRDASDIMLQVRINRKTGTHWSEPAELPGNLRADVATRVFSDSPIGLAETPREKKGDARVAILPDAMEDFAINRTTGDIACIGSSVNRAFILRTKELKSGPVESLPEVDVGNKPVTITYKPYQDKAYFIVGCSINSDLYVLNADPFGLIQKVSVDGQGVTHVAASPNPEDPFVYYNHKSSNNVEVGAIDLREMVDRGRVFDQSLDLALSADGRIAYRRGPWSPSGFESLRMTSEFTDSKPTFQRLVYEHRSTGAYVPGPFGQLTATGNAMYTVALDKRLSTLDFVPACFFQSEPIFVGLSIAQRASSRETKLLLRAASYNRFTSVGAALELPPGLIAALPSPGRVRSQVSLKGNLLADDVNKQVVLASNDKVALIPLESLELPDEPFMQLNLTSVDLRVGAEQTIEVRPTDEKVSMQLGELPDGMNLVEGGFGWKPHDQHVGTTRVPITLFFDDIEKVMDLKLNVAQPSIKTPIEIRGFLMGPRSSFCVCWSGPALDPYGRPVRTTSNTNVAGCQLCVIPFRKGLDPITTELSFVIRQAAIIGNRIALVSATEDQQVHIYDLRTLERQKLLLSTSQVTGIEVKGKQFSINGRNSVDIHSVTSLKRLRTIDAPSSVAYNSRATGSQSQPLMDGILTNGVFRSIDGSAPLLILAPGRITSLQGAQSDLMRGTFLRRVTPQRSSTQRGSSSSDSIVAGPIAMPEAGLQVFLQNRVTTKAASGSSQRQTEHRVALLAIDEHGTATVPILKQPVPSDTRPPTPSMQVIDKFVMVACGSRIYRWVPQSRSSRSGPGADQGQQRSLELHFVPKQSAFIATGRTTLLRHELKGGSPPYDYFLMTRLDGVEINDKTGDVSLSRESLLDSAASFFTSIARRVQSGDIAQELQRRASSFSQEFSRLTGRKPKGYPIAVPIHVKASDSDGKVAQLQYFVLMDISLREVASILNSSR